MSKKPKTPDVAAVWHEVKGISNGLAALRMTVAVDGNRTTSHAKLLGEAFDRIKHLGMVVEEVQLELAPRGFNRPPGNSVKERLDKHEAWITGLQNAEIDAQAVGEQIGDLEVRVGNLEPLHTSVSMLEAKVAQNAEDLVLSEKRITGAWQEIAELHARISEANRRWKEVASRDTLRSVVTVLVIVQAFTVIAFLAWVLGGGR